MKIIMVKSLLLPDGEDGLLIPKQKTVETLKFIRLHYVYILVFKVI